MRTTLNIDDAAIAEANGCALLARDRDMDAILDSGFVKTKRWQ